MKRITQILVMIIFSTNLPAQEYLHPQKNEPGYLGESQYFRFYNHFWLNMHYFLYNRAVEYDGKKVEEFFEKKHIAALPKEKQEQLADLLEFYRSHMIDQDLRTGGYHHSYKRWVVQYNEKERLPVPEKGTEEHIERLNQFAPLYRQYFWKKHKKANLKVFRQNRSLVKKLEHKAVQRLTELSQRQWEKEKIRVDLSYFSKLNRPFTTTRPTTHIVMESMKNHQPRGNWLELLFHEASHHLIFPSNCFVGDAIKKAAGELGLSENAVRNMWHIYLFYFSGRVVEALLEEEWEEDYELYMVRNGVFSRSFPQVNEFLPAYMNGKKGLLAVTKEILEASSNDR